jgi:hypothetical protein
LIKAYTLFGWALGEVSDAAAFRDQRQRLQMIAIAIAITAWLDDAQPGVVACTLIDAWGHEHTIIEKAPVVTAVALDRNSIYPQPGVIACEVVQAWIDQHGRRLVTISTERPWGITSVEGQTHFDVQLERFMDLT